MMRTDTPCSIACYAVRYSLSAVLEQQCLLSPAHGEAVFVAHDRKAHNAYSEVQVARHALQQPPLLVILAPKQRHVRLHNVEQLGHHLQRGDTALNIALNFGGAVLNIALQCCSTQPQRSVRAWHRSHRCMSRTSIRVHSHGHTQVQCAEAHRGHSPEECGPRLAAQPLLQLLDLHAGGGGLKCATRWQVAPLR